MAKSPKSCMASHDNDFERVNLSVIDQTIVRPYIRNVLCFPFPDHSKRSQAVSSIKRALEAVIHRRPYLGGTIGLEPKDGQKNGRLEWLYSKTIPDLEASGVLAIKDIDAKTIPETYKELSDEGMPPSKLKPEILSTLPSMADQTKPSPVFAMQVSFISGGLLLTTYLHHSVADGTTWGALITELADEIRRGGSTHSKGVEPFPRI